MTMTRRRFYLGVAAAVLVLVVGFLWMQASVRSYDQRWADCMRAKEAALYPHGFPDSVYDEAMRDCERQAGAPVRDTGHPHPWDEKP
jgi:hypothetical protein